MAETPLSAVASAMECVRLVDVRVDRQALLRDCFVAAERASASELGLASLAGRIAAKRAAAALLEVLTGETSGPSLSSLSIESPAPGRYVLKMAESSAPACATLCRGIALSVSHTSRNAYGLAVHGGPA